MYYVYNSLYKYYKVYTIDHCNLKIIATGKESYSLCMKEKNDWLVIIHFKILLVDTNQTKKYIHGITVVPRDGTKKCTQLLHTIYKIFFLDH